MVKSTRMLGLQLAAAIAILVGLGCTGPFALRPSYDYFGSPEADDAWSRKISRWQERERYEQGDDHLRSPVAVAGSGPAPEIQNPDDASLQSKYAIFRSERKRVMARELADWIQEQARQHYMPDGPVDRWATLEETFRSDGDDCDGLELLTFNLLQELGFSSEEVYRAIVYRRSDGQHHMVTLWFEDKEDPWVLDPTGAMTSGMPRMSEVPEWTPLKVFSEDEDFSVLRQAVASRSRR